MRIFFILIVFKGFTAGYLLDDISPSVQDSEIQLLWGSLDDLYNPRIDDYLKIQEYLMCGRRPYLDDLYKHLYHFGLIEEDPRFLFFCDRSKLYNYRILQEIQLVSPYGDAPEFHRIALGGATLDEKSCCIVLYATYNKQSELDSLSYLERLQEILEDLEREGYRGHVVYRIGGYPLLLKGGIRFAHIPYSFKILSIIEASQMGYENVLWLDTALHPANDLSEIFKEISTKGSYLVTNLNSFDLDYHLHLIPNHAIMSADLDVSDLKKIPHINGGIIGLSFKFQFVHDLIDEWFDLTKSLYPALSLYPEEFLLSVARWRIQCDLSCSFYEACLFKSVHPDKPHQAQKPFWFDKQ